MSDKTTRDDVQYELNRRSSDVDEASRFGLVEADPAIQFEAACKVLGVEG